MYQFSVFFLLFSFVSSMVLSLVLHIFVSCFLFFSQIKDPTGVFGFGDMGCPEVSPRVRDTKITIILFVGQDWVETNSFSGSAIGFHSVL